MKTKPHQLNRRANAINIDRCHAATSTTHEPSFSDQKPKVANLLGNLRKAWPPSNLVIELKTKERHSPPKKVASFEKDWRPFDTESKTRLPALFL